MKTQSKSVQKRIAAQPKQRKRTAIVKTEQFTLAEAIEKVLITGDLMPLTSEQRVSYYKTVCKSLGLNPLTRPFDYIVYNNKLQFYATRNCTDQLRKIHGISVTKLNKAKNENLSSAEVEVRDKTGRTDAATGEVWIQGMKGTELCNALMKTETKAKRRATLSICGLSFLDEIEIEGLDDYNEVTPRGRVIIEQTGSRDAQQAIATEKIKDLKEKLNYQPALFWTQPPEQNGNYFLLTGDANLLAKWKEWLIGPDIKAKWKAEPDRFLISIDHFDTLQVSARNENIPFKELKAAQ